jgi:hypothetical protein
MKKQDIPKHLQWITYQGRKILFSNYRYMEKENVVTNIEKGVEYITQMKDPKLLVLLDFTGMGVSNRIYLKILEADKNTGIGARVFETDMDAKQWLSE